jgi:protease-4
MAARRDIIIGIIIAVSFVAVIGFLGLVLIGLMAEGGQLTLGGFGARIAVVEVFGTITSSGDVVRQLKKWGESGNIEAIVLHVNSPGGAIAPSQEIYDEILRVREEDGKIVVVSMSSVAASGGYYISCAADRIMANPGTITGSIGVIIQYPTARELFHKIGVKFETVKSGKLKDVGSIDREMTDAEYDMLKAMVMDSYEQFVEAVAKNRPIEIDSVYALADGSVFSGRQGYEYGLVDTLGGFEDAIRMAADMAGIKGKPETIKEIKPDKGLFDLLGGTLKSIESAVSVQSSGPKVMYLY